MDLLRMMRGGSSAERGDVSGETALPLSGQGERAWHW